MANAYAERWVGTVRGECLDLILNQRHLRWVLDEHLAHYNSHRPLRGIQNRAPQGTADISRHDDLSPARVHRHPALGGLINEYRPAA
ncbi:MAG TPA: integrase core domain-containing protein [Acidimicrobiia bacterium]|nr:integrase core domain-containing protein [Acidimicrobiia bacterium]